MTASKKSLNLKTNKNERVIIMLSEESKILIPTDFSDYSRAAFQYGISLATKFGSSIILLHVIEPPYNFATTMENTLEKLKENANDELKEWAEKGIREKKVTADTVLETGMTISSILDSVREKDIDLVIMGSKGETGFAKILFGSVATDIMLHSTVPVLTVPVEMDSFEMNSILFTTDLREKDFESLKEVVKLAKSFNSNIDVLHIAEKNEFEDELRFTGFREMAKERIDFSDIEFNRHENENALEGINEYLNSQSFSLIVMTRYKKSVIGKLLGKRHTDKIGSYTNKPVLVLIA
jgi:nucleotide-binding universal stress UspA family protein